MTLKDIAIFKHFLAGKDLRKPFIKTYNRSKEFAKLPDKIEDFLSNVQPTAVILSACRVCHPNGAFSYSFFQDLHQAWKEYYAKHEGNIGTDNLPTLTGYFMILRENWNNADKPWRYEDVNVAAARLGLDPIELPKPEPAPPAEEKPAACPVSCATSAAPEDPALDIDFIDFDTTSRRMVGALNKGMISVNTRSHSWRVTINRSDSKEIRDKRLSRVMMGRTKTGDVVMQLCNNTSGIPVLINVDNYVNINSRRFVESLNRLMSVTDDLAYLRIEKIAETTDSITYKVTKQ